MVNTFISKKNFHFGQRWVCVCEFWQIAHPKTHTCACVCDWNFGKMHTCVRCACGRKSSVRMCVRARQKTVATHSLLKSMSICQSSCKEKQSPEFKRFKNPKVSSMIVTWHLPIWIEDLRGLGSVYRKIFWTRPISNFSISRPKGREIEIGDQSLVQKIFRYTDPKPLRSTQFPETSTYYIPI